MSGQHTPGRLVVGELTGAVLVDERGDHIASTYNGAIADNILADARRVAACWNVFAGVPTEYVEALSGVGTALSDLAAERDQLRSEVEAAGALLGEVLEMGVHDLAEPDMPEGVRSTGDLEALQARIHALRPDENTFTAADRVRTMAQAAAATAARWGYVLTITQRPRLPLAMGNYDTVVEVRPARGAA
jgi:outer membrane murein-binding lipoprotein Lpp